MAVQYGMAFCAIIILLKLFSIGLVWYVGGVLSIDILGEQMANGDNYVQDQRIFLDDRASTNFILLEVMA